MHSVAFVELQQRERQQQGATPAARDLRAATGAHSSSQDTGGGLSRSEGGGAKEWRVDVPKPLGLILKQGDRTGSAGVWGSEFVSS
jgi:hypothetical protein